jgi:hypothetical protein
MPWLIIRSHVSLSTPPDTPRQLTFKLHEPTQGTSGTHGREIYAKALKTVEISTTGQTAR